MKRHILTLFSLLILCIGQVWADMVDQSVQINVMTLQQPMPAAALEYYTNGGNFLSISLSNTTQQAQVVRLELELRGPIPNAVNDMEACGNSFLWLKSQEAIMSSFVLPPGQTRAIAPNELSLHFQQYPANQNCLQMNGAILDAVTDMETLGLLPEGHYGLRIRAISNTADNPISLKGEGTCYFDICYNASAPTFTQPHTSASVSPLLIDSEGLTCYEFPADAATYRFAWTIPQFNANLHRGQSPNFTYDFRLYRLNPGETPSQAHQVAYQQLNLMTNFCDIPVTNVWMLRKTGSYFVAQVTARTPYTNASQIYYTRLQNDGKSPLKLIKFNNISTSPNNSDTDSGTTAGGSGGGSDGQSVDTGSDGDLPITVTVKPKYDLLPVEMEDYFAQPAKLFDVTVENVSANDEEICGLLQFYQEDRGVTVAINRQHTDRHLNLPAHSKLELNAEQINQLLGGYDVNTDVQLFTPHSGKIIGKLDDPNFKTEQYTVYCRICRYTGTGLAVVKEKTIGKGRDVFTPTAGVKAGQPIVATIRLHADAGPVTTNTYFDEPSRIFDVELRNISKSAVKCRPVLFYDLELQEDTEAKIFIGDADRRLNYNKIEVPANGKVLLTSDQIDQLLGEFANICQYDEDLHFLKIKSVISFDGLLDPEQEQHVKLYCFDEKALSDHHKFSTDLEEHLIGESEQLDFNVSADYVMHDIGIKVTPRLQSIPLSSRSFFERPGSLFKVSIKNYTHQQHRLALLPAIRVVPDPDDDEVRYLTGDAMHRKLDGIFIRPDEELELSESDINKYCGYLYENYGIAGPDLKQTGTIRALDKQELGKDGDKVDIRFWMLDWDLYDEDFRNGKGPLAAHVLNSDLLNSTLSGKMMAGDIEVSLDYLMKPNMPRRTRYYFELPEQLFSATFKNVSDHDVKFIPELSLTNTNDSTVMGDYSEKITKDFITLKKGQSLTLSPDSVRLFFSGFKNYYVRLKDARAENQMKTEKGDTLRGLGAMSEHLKATIRIIDCDSISKYKTKVTERYQLIEKALNGKTVIEFPVSWSVDVGCVQTIIKKKNVDGGNSLADYLKEPGKYFDVRLVSLDGKQHEVMLDLCYDNRYYVPVWGKSGRTITVPMKDTLQVTPEGLTRMCGNFDIKDVMAIDPKTGESAPADDPKLGAGGGMVTVYTMQANAKDKSKCDTLSCDSCKYAMRLQSVKINDFTLTLTSATESTHKDKDGKVALKGEGYIEWAPIPGMHSLNFAVRFDSIWIDKENKVTRGSVMSKQKTENGSFLSSNWFDPALSDQAHEDAIETALKGSEYEQYYRYAKDGMELIDDLLARKVEEPVKLPIGIGPDNSILKACPIGVQIYSAQWTPTRSWVNLVGSCEIGESDKASTSVLAFGAPFLTITPTTLSAEDGALALLGDMQFTDPKTGYKCTFYKPQGLEFSKLTTIEQCIAQGKFDGKTSGCYVSWHDGEFSEMSFEASIDDIPNLLLANDEGHLIDNTGNPVDDFAKAGAPDIRLKGSMDKDQNWLVAVTMQPFQHKDALGFTFMSTGDNGAWYDRSTKESPAGLTGQLFKDTGYDLKHKNIPIDQKAIEKAKEAAEKKGEKYKEPKDDEKPRQWTEQNVTAWTGLFWPKMTVIMPEYITKTTTDKDGKTVPSRATFGIENVIYDVTGLTGKASVKFNGMSCEAAGWGISLDEIYLHIVQSNFNDAGFNGGIEVPFFSMVEKSSDDDASKDDDKKDDAKKDDNKKDDGKKDDGKPAGSGSKTDQPTGNTKATIAYRANLSRINQERDNLEEGTYVLKFDVTVKNKTHIAFDGLPCDISMSGSKFEFSYTHYADPAKHDGKKSKTEVGLVINGDISISSDLSLGVDLPGIHVYNMYLANHEVQIIDSLQTKYNSAKVKFEAPVWHNGGGDKSKASIFFSLGYWSLASEEKHVGPFKFKLTDFSAKEVKLDGSKLDVELLVGGMVALLGDVDKIEEGDTGIATGGASVRFPFSFDFEDKSVSLSAPKFGKVFFGFKLDGHDWKNGDPTEADAGSSSFAGLSFYGELEAVDGNMDGFNTSGYKGKLNLSLSDLFKLDVEGGFFKATSDTVKESFTAGYLVAAASGAGIDMGVVKLKGIKGGFFVNCYTQAKTVDSKVDDIKIKHGSHGIMLGVTLTDNTGELVKGDMNLYVFIDVDNHTLSQLTLLGRVNALMTPGGSGDGLIKADACIQYVHTDTEHFFELNITAEAKVSADAIIDGTGAGKALQTGLSGLQAKINSLAPGLSDDSKSNIDKAQEGSNVNMDGKNKGAFADDNANEQKKFSDTENKRGETDKTDASKPKMEVGASVSLDLRFDFKKDTWHLYIGKPEYEQRCRFDIIDFSVGNKNIGMGAKLGANFYLCIGSEQLDLPGLPDKVAEFLGTSEQGEESKGAVSGLSSDTSDRMAQRQKIMNNNEGGFMFGAEVYGSFWCNALICYAKLEMDAGFDLAILRLVGKACAETHKRPGKNGFYGTGQLYAYLAGEFGVMFHLFGADMDIPLCEVKLGGALRAGFPNPTWFQGTFKAKGELFGGLIKFEKKCTVEAGQVCTPMVASPLENIDIFNRITVNDSELYETRSSGWNKKNGVSDLASVVFETNMNMNQTLELMDENNQAAGWYDSNRMFRFKLVTTEIQQWMGSDDPTDDEAKDASGWKTIPCKLSMLQMDRYRLRSADKEQLPANGRFRVLLIGTADEKDYDKSHNGTNNTNNTYNKWTFPYFIATEDSTVWEIKDINRDPVEMHLAWHNIGDTYQVAWYDTLVNYFCTGDPDLAIDGPNTMLARYGSDYRDEAKDPYLVLRRPLLNEYQKDGKYLVMRMSECGAKNEPRLDASGNAVVGANGTTFLDVSNDLDNLKKLYEMRIIEETQDGASHWRGDRSTLEEFDWVGTTKFNFDAGGSKPRAMSEYSWNGNNVESHLMDDKRKFVFQIVQIDPNWQPTPKEETPAPTGITLADAQAVAAANGQTLEQYIASQTGGWADGSAATGESYSPLASSDGIPYIIDTSIEGWEEGLNEAIAAGANITFINSAGSGQQDDAKADNGEVVLWQRDFVLSTRQSWKQDIESQTFYTSAQARALMTLMGLKSKTRKTYLYDMYKLSDYDWMKIGNVPDNPFSLMAMMSHLGTAQYYVADYVYIPSSLSDQSLPGMMLSVTGPQMTKYSRAWVGASQSNMQTFIDVPTAKNQSELQNSYSAYTWSRRMLPSTWDPVPRTVDEPASMDYSEKWGATSGDNLSRMNDAYRAYWIDNFLSAIRDYVSAYTNASLKFVETFDELERSFCRAGNFDYTTGARTRTGRGTHSSIQSWSSSNIGKGVQTCIWGDNSNAGKINFRDDETLKNSLNRNYQRTMCYFTFDIAQIPFLYARANPEDGFYLSTNWQEWFAPSGAQAVTDWTQRLITEKGQFYYFTPKEILFNRDYSRRFISLWHKFTKDDIASKFNNWYNDQKIVMKIYRPNHYDFNTGGFSVGDFGSSTTETNVIEKEYNLQ